MRREQVFTAHPGAATPAKPVTLAEAGLRERNDLQEWIRKHPDILGAGVRIVTYEFDRWLSGAGKESDRLDLLGLDPDGRLVVAELKRDGAPNTVEMQAIKYAAYASRFDAETLAACHGVYLRKTSDPQMSDEDALAQLNEHCGGLDPSLWTSPRIVLVAGTFPAPVTASVVWLCDQGLDITLVQVAAYQAQTDLVITVSQLWPIPDVGDFMVSPVAPKGPTGPASRKGRGRAAVSVILDEALLHDGDELTINPAGKYASQVQAWLDDNPGLVRAIWRTDDKIKALEWPPDDGRYSASGLAEHIIDLACGEQASINGAEWWRTAGGETLAELAGFNSSVRDWTDLHEMLAMLGSGEWTTYGELSGAIGTHPNPLGQHVARCSQCPNAWRVLGADGKPRPGFTWSDPTETRSCRDVLESEGVTFGAGGAANPAARVSGETLRGRTATSAQG